MLAKILYILKYLRQNLNKFVLKRIFPSLFVLIITLVYKLDFILFRNVYKYYGRHSVRIFLREIATYLSQARREDFLWVYGASP